jgi:hypothetical protein
MARSSSRSRNNGGIGGSGIFGFFGTTIHCDSKDTSMYCNIMKVFNLILIALIIYYLAWAFIPKLFKR